MSEFRWKNRMFCLYRIQVLVSCLQLDLDKAISQALRFQFPSRGEYEYCNYPELITGKHVQLLRRDAEAMIQKYRKGA